MPRISKAVTCLMLVSLIFGSAMHSTPAFAEPVKVRELAKDDTRALYVDKVISSEINDTGERKIDVNFVCKNLLAKPNACVDIFFFSLLGTSGKHYSANLAESRVMPARIPERDSEQGAVTFVIPKAENATKIIYSEPNGTNFVVDPSSKKDPADKPPTSEWNLISNKGQTISDSRIELKINDETLSKDHYILDISIRNTGGAVLDYNALYAYVKSTSGLVFGADPYADVEPKLASGTLHSGQEVRGKIAFNVGGESGLFMFIYDDITGSYLTTGKFIPSTSSGIRGEVIGTEDLVKIEKHNASRDPITGAYKVVGEVSNNSGKFVTSIEIHTVLKDKSRNILTNRNQTLTNFLSSHHSNLAPGAKIPFFVDFNLPSAEINSIGSYQLSISYSFAEPKVSALLLNNTEVVLASNPKALAKDVLWEIQGLILNLGKFESKYTHITASAYDSGGSIIAVGGFSTLDKQPKALNSGQKKLFSIEITLPPGGKPSSFYLYAESEQYVMIVQSNNNSTAVEKEKQTESKQPENLPVQNSNQTLVKIMAKQRHSLMQIVIRDLSNSTSSIYGLQVSINGTALHTLKAKSGWDTRQIADNVILLSTLNSPIKVGQQARFLFTVENTADLILWKALDLHGTDLLEGKVKPFQLRPT